MPEGEKLWGGAVVIGGHNLPSPSKNSVNWSANNWGGGAMPVPHQSPPVPAWLCGHKLSFMFEIGILICQNHCDLIKPSCTLLHDWNAFLAAWTAVSTSLVPETGTFANNLPLLGSRSLMTPAEVSTGDTRWLLIQLYGPDTLRKVVDIFLMKVWLKWRK